MRPDSSAERRRTDYGTVALHGLLMLALLVAALTGLRLAADDRRGSWLGWADSLISASSLWRLHLLSGLMLAGILVAYVVYMQQAKLSRRIYLGRDRLAGLRHAGRARLSTLNAAVHWLFFLLLPLQLATGALLYLGYDGNIVTLHLAGTVLIVAYLPLHVAMQWLRGGRAQILRIFRPGPIVSLATARPLAEALTEHLARMNRELADPDNEDAPSHARDPNRTSASMPSTQLHANPLAVAVAAGLTFSGVAFYADQATRDVLVIDAIPAAQAPRLDGDLSDPVWTSARPVVIRTNLAANFGGAASSRIEVRAVHDGTNAYFAFVWDDPTRSLKHLPLLKKADGWHVLQQGYDVGDETRIFEDGLAVLLSRTSDAALARNLDLGSPSAVGASPPGRGPQDAADGRLIDVWRWQASRGGLLGFIDDGHAIAGATGFASDPGKTFFSHNFKEQAPGGYARPVQPLRLPKDPGALMSAMGRIDLDAEHGEPESARWWLTADESVPYTPALDNKIGVGTVIPGVVIAGEYAGDRAHVRCAAHWAAGRWTLEVARRLNTGSPYDVTLSSGVYMWVAAFDHSQSRPARHLRPVRLELK